MRIASIAVACTLALATAARAQDAPPAPTPAPLALAPGGTGDALYLPYWAVDDDTSTLLSVVNTDDQVKAVRVTLVGAEDAEPVHSFTLYLAPRDRYEAALVAAADGGAGVELSSDDGSCTLPQPAAAADPDPAPSGEGDGPPVQAAVAASGAIEVIELGVLPGDAADLPAVDDCDALAAAFEAGGRWAEDANAGLAPPGGGLGASVEVVNEAEATVAAFPATAFSGFSARARQLAPEAPPPRITEPFAAGEGGSLRVDLGDAPQEFTEAEGAAAIAALLDTPALHGAVAGDATARSRWLLAVPGGTDGCIAATAQAFAADGTEAGPATPLEICGGTTLVAVGEEAAGAPSALQFPASAGGSATLRFATEEGAPVIGYSLASIGPDLPAQASDRAREAVGPAWLVVQPLLREAPAALEPDPLPPPAEVPADG